MDIFSSLIMILMYCSARCRGKLIHGCNNMHRLKTRRQEEKTKIKPTASAEISLLDLILFCHRQYY